MHCSSPQRMVLCGALWKRAACTFFHSGALLNVQVPFPLVQHYTKCHMHIMHMNIVVLCNYAYSLQWAVLCTTNVDHVLYLRSLCAFSTTCSCLFLLRTHLSHWGCHYQLMEPQEWQVFLFMYVWIIAWYWGLKSDTVGEIY